MTKLLRTTLATAFAATCIAGATVAFAAEQGGRGVQGNVDGHQTINRNSPDQQEKLDQTTTGAISTCDDKTSDQHAACYDGLPTMK